MNRLYRRLLGSYRLRNLRNRYVANDFRVRFYDDALLRAFGDIRPTASDISDHLVTIFSDVVSLSPTLVVELGTRGGESTKAILAAARYSSATVLSVDIDPCSIGDVAPELTQRWHFVQADDVEFAKTGFVPWCAAHGLRPLIDVLFIDTSHLYEHTRAEIREWFPYLQPSGAVLFHDTNLKGLGVTYNNAVLAGWENERGVIRAIEEFLEHQFREDEFFAGVIDGWLVRHHPNSFGLTLLRRLAGPHSADAT